MFFLLFDFGNFKDLVSKNGKIRKWYEILKEGTERVVDRIFITGVAPITLDSFTSGFNISKDITRDERFNGMIRIYRRRIGKIDEKPRDTRGRTRKIIANNERKL